MSSWGCSPGAWPTGLSDGDVTLLAIRALGDRMATDRLGRSERTIQRQVQRVMTLLGVQSRFQLGVEANQRGRI